MIFSGIMLSGLTVSRIEKFNFLSNALNSMLKFVFPVVHFKILF